MENKEISKVFELIGKLLEIKGDNVFKSRAYYNAARTIAVLPISLKQAAADGSVKDIKGIGSALEKKIIEMLNTGKLGYLERLKSEIPEEVIEMLKIPGLGPGKIHKLIDILGIKTIGELEYACRVNRLKVMDGFGEKSQENILKGIELIKHFRGRVLYYDAKSIADDIVANLKDIPCVKKVDIAGSVRRCMETVKDIDIVAVVDEIDRAKTVASFKSMDEVEEVFEQGPAKVLARFKSGIVCNLRIVNEPDFPVAIHHFTGSAGHNTALSSHAERNGLKIDKYGIFKNDSRIRIDKEEDLFSKLGMDYIPPELREDTGEIDAALEHKIPELIEYNDIKGIFHVHTVWSDGSNTIAEMAESAKNMDMEYIGISDHSASAGYAGGLTSDDVKRQWDEIDEYNSKNRDKAYVFKGIESDILRDGSLDYDDSLLEQFDFVIASIHSWFSMSLDEAIERILRALSHPSVTMLGHPTGRLLLSREGYPVDMEKILDACSEHNVTIELNANPQRLDIDWRYLRAAKSRGVSVSINPDSHNASTLAHLRYGVNIARKGWLEKKDVFNTYSLKMMQKRMNKNELRK